MEIVLTSEQLRQVEELKKKDQVNSGFVGLVCFVSKSAHPNVIVYYFVCITY